MTKTIRLTGQQRTLLAEAAKHPEGKLRSSTHPVPVTEEPTRKAIASLLRRNLLVETEVKADEPHWRSVDDVHYGLAITDKGRETIGFETFHDFQDNTPEELDAPSPPVHPRKPRAATSTLAKQMPTPTTKISMVIALLKREQGATLDDLGEATGWLPHTTRAAMTGLKKKDHNLASDKIDGVRTYRIVDAGRAS